VALTAPYFHSGAVWSLPEAVHLMGTAQLGADLSAEEVDAIVAFLGSLTGEQPAVIHPILPTRTGGTPHPDQF
jgi:cytochrome c peroxidase